MLGSSSLLLPIIQKSIADEDEPERCFACMQVRFLPFSRAVPYLHADISLFNSFSNRGPKKMGLRAAVLTRRLVLYSEAIVADTGSILWSSVSADWCANFCHRTPCVLFLFANAPPTLTPAVLKMFSFLSKFQAGAAPAERWLLKCNVSRSRPSNSPGSCLTHLEVVRTAVMLVLKPLVSPATAYHLDVIFPIAPNKHQARKAAKMRRGRLWLKLRLRLSIFYLR